MDCPQFGFHRRRLERAGKSSRLMRCFLPSAFVSFSSPPPCMVLPPSDSGRLGLTRFGRVLKRGPRDSRPRAGGRLRPSINSRMPWLSLPLRRLAPGRRVEWPPPRRFVSPRVLSFSAAHSTRWRWALRVGSEPSLPSAVSYSWAAGRAYSRWRSSTNVQALTSVTPKVLPDHREPHHDGRTAV